MKLGFRKFFTDHTWREDKVAAYASVGLLVFLTSFLWAPTRDFMHVVYGLTFFAPILLVLLLRKPEFNQYGGWFTGLALLYAGYASISTLWSDAPRLEFFAQHFLFLNLIRRQVVARTFSRYLGKNECGSIAFQ